MSDNSLQGVKFSVVGSFSGCQRLAYLPGRHHIGGISLQLLLTARQGNRDLLLFAGVPHNIEETRD